MTSALERAIGSLPGQKTANSKIPAAKTFLIKPEHFAATWSDKPIDGILLGIRVPSEKEVQGARFEAIKIARSAQVEDDSPDADTIRLNAFNDALLALAVSSAICDPKDVSANHPFFDMPDELVPLALTPKTIQHIWDLTESLHVEQSPVFAEITPEEEVKLIQLLSEDEPYNGIDPVSAKRARRFLKFALDTLEE
jgi:hypothetical protein